MIGRPWTFPSFPRLSSSLIRKPRCRLRPSPEVLEDRRLLATITVNTLGDPATPVAGFTSLREAIAESGPGDTDTIDFLPGLSGTIHLDPNQGFLEPQFQTNLTIIGPGADKLTIDGQGATGILAMNGETTLNLSGLTLADGNARFGGAIENFGTMTVTDCIFSGNTASGAGGAIQTNNDPLTLIGCTISGNSAGAFGGGVENFRGSVTMVDCTVSGNSSGDVGGALANYGGPMTLLSCTVAGNSAASAGGGLCNGFLNDTSATATLDNTILSDSPSEVDIVNNGTLTGTNNLVSDGSGIGLSGTITGNPLLAPLASYGGPTPTMALFAGSPAIGAASTSISIPGVTLPHTDQRGLPRVVVGLEDIGAFQTQPGQGNTPTVAISGPATALAQEQLIFTFTATDPTPTDQSGTFAYAIDWDDGSDVEIVQGSSSVQVVHAYAAGSYDLTVTALDQDGRSSFPTEVASPFTVAALSGPNLSQAVQAQMTVALQVSTVTQENAAFNAINNVKPPSAGWSVAVNMAPGQYSDVVIDAPGSGQVTVSPPPPSTGSTSTGGSGGSGGSSGTVVSGGSTSPPASVGWDQATTTAPLPNSVNIDGNSPALTVENGTVTVSGIQLSTDTDSPTIVVTGGTLILQDDFIVGTPSGNQPVIEVDGGTLILGPAIAIGNPSTAGASSTGLSSGKVQLQGNVLAAYGTAPFVHVTGTGQVIDDGGNTYDQAASDGTLTPIAGQVTVTQLASSANPAVYGQPVTFTATIANISGTGLVPTGTVQFVVDGTNLGTAVPLDATGQAVSPAVSFLAGASHAIQAVYNPSSNFIGGNNSLTQVVQPIAVEPDPSNPALTDLFLGSIGATSNDRVQVNPVGSSSTGSTGVQVQSTLDDVRTQSTFLQSFSTVCAYLQNGNDHVRLANTLTINAVVTAGNGNDHVSLGNGNNTVTLGDGNDHVSAGDGNNTVTVGNGNDWILLGNGSDVIVEGNGNDAVWAGNGMDTVTVGNGNDWILLGNGSDVIVEGNGNDLVWAGDGADLVVGGLGRHIIQLGDGNDILIDGSATVVNPGDSFRQILSDWNTSSAASVDTRLKVVYNTTHPNVLVAGSGRDWWFFTNNKDWTNIKRRDRLN